VLFISWLAKIVPLFKGKKELKSIFSASLVYILPVISGLGLFAAQIRVVPNHKEIILNKMRYRMLDSSAWTGNKIVGIIRNFAANYSFIGLVTLGLLFVLTLFFIIRKNGYTKMFLEKYQSLIRIFLIVYIPPVFQVLVLQQHSAIHEFSVLKFGFPFVFAIPILVIMVMELRKCFSTIVIIPIENNVHTTNVSIPVFNVVIITILFVLAGCFMNQNKYYFDLRMDEAVSYEREYLIRNNYEFNDVYFSFTESIEANPPQYLAISKKLIYKINTVSEISQKFPSLDKEGPRFLLIVNKNNRNKSEAVLENENSITAASKLVFSSENFNVFQFPLILSKTGIIFPKF
jgi:hypothetical protein